METTLLIMSKEDQEVISEWLTFYLKKKFMTNLLKIENRLHYWLSIYKII